MVVPRQHPVLRRTPGRTHCAEGRARGRPLGPAPGRPARGPTGHRQDRGPGPPAGRRVRPDRAARHRRTVGGVRRIRRRRPAHASRRGQRRTAAGRTRPLAARGGAGRRRCADTGGAMELEQKAPVALVIDDAQWADIDSLRALLFVARRLVRERVLLVFTQRTEDAVRLPEGLSRLATGRTGTTIALQPLTGEELQRLAAGARHHPTLRADRPPPAGAHGRQPALHQHRYWPRCPRSVGIPGSRCCLPPGRSRCRSRAASRCAVRRPAAWWRRPRCWVCTHRWHRRPRSRTWRTWSRPSTKPSMWVWCRSATTASGTSVSSTVLGLGRHLRAAGARSAGSSCT